MNSIITQVMALFGIASAPVTVSEFLWDLIILVVGLFIVKYVMIFFSSLFSEAQGHRHRKVKQ